MWSSVSKTSFLSTSWGHTTSNLELGVWDCFALCMLHGCQHQPIVYHSYMGYIGALLAGLIPVAVLSLGMTYVQIPASILARIPQIQTNFKAKSTGQLSFLTALMGLGGSVARIGTTLKETGDTIILTAFSIASVLNLIIMIQFLMYWNNKTRKD
eukprot:TRINITY_DN1454_c0_g1_i2.p2 TRINITY_DN1454_c0_g1~~TRINITY_DN1454_c0_g1_i2.p2  ORF type:complete len:155 (-),score=12.22 TRINITY_DN1454_c0_g1_i2:131-595(-)